MPAICTSLITFHLQLMITITINNPTLDDKTFIGWTIEGSNERPNKNLTISITQATLSLLRTGRTRYQSFMKLTEIYLITVIVTSMA